MLYLRCFFYFCLHLNVGVSDEICIEDSLQVLIHAQEASKHYYMHQTTRPWLTY
jgi:hypothetical protein